MKRYHSASVAVEVAEREQMLAWSMLFCSCVPWWQGFGSAPPQDGCMVHGRMLIHPDGRVL